MQPCSFYLKATLALAALLLCGNPSEAWIATFGAPMAPRPDPYQLRFYEVCDHFRAQDFRVRTAGDIYTFHRLGTAQMLSLRRQGIYATAHQVTKVNAFLTSLNLPTLRSAVRPIIEKPPRI